MTTYFVSISGNDSNPGTISLPWRTIQKAADTISAGDIAYIRNGTYNEHVSITRSGSQNNYLTFQAYPGELVIIDGTGKVGSWDGIIHVTSANWIKVVGFAVTNSSFFGIMIDNYGGTRSSNIVIQNNFVSNIGHTGIYAENSDYITYDGNIVTNTQTDVNQVGENVDLVGVNYFEIMYNHIYATANFESLVVKLGCTNGSIHHNDISPTQSAGIYVDAWTSLNQYIDIYDNYVHDSSYSTSRGIAIGAEQTGSHTTNINIYNNIITNLASIGINIPWYSKGTVDYIKIINNTVYRCDTTDKWAGGIAAQVNSNNGTTSNITIRNNIVSQNGAAQISTAPPDSVVTNNLIDGTGGITGTNYVTGNPLFVNPSTNDFHLQSASPATGQGTSTDAPSTDFDGNIRPQGAYYDIGAYEYVTVSTQPPTTQCNSNTQFNIPSIGCVPKNYIVYSGIGFGALMILTMLK